MKLRCRHAFCVGIRAAIALAGALAPLASANAQVRLDWQSPAECPTSEVARGEIERLLNRRLNSMRAAGTVSVDIARESSARFRARIAPVSNGPAREHVVYDIDCVVLSRAAALIVALALDPGMQSAPRTRTPNQASPPQPTAPPAEADGGAFEQPRALADSAEPTGPIADSPRSELEVRPAARASPPPEPPVPMMAARVKPEQQTADARLGPPQIWAWRISVGFGLSAGLTPGLGPVSLCSGSFGSRELQAAVRVSYAFPQLATLKDSAGAGGSVALASAGFELDLRSVRVGPFAVPLIAGLEAGFFTAAGRGVASRRSQSAVWAAGYVGSGVVWTWTPTWGTALRVDGLLPLRRPEFALENTTGSERQIFHRPASLGMRVYLLLEMHFP